MSNYEESDEYCPHCDNHYVRWDAILSRIFRVNHFCSTQVIEAKTPAPVIGVEGEDARVDARYELLIYSVCYVFLTTWFARMLKDDRVKPKNTRSFFSQLDEDELADKLG